MPKGGARARSGPAPDPMSVRQTEEWVELPAGGRPGDAPEWPLSDASGRELVVWGRLWSKPQAVMWDAEGQHDVVALYVRRFCEAEERGSATNLSTLVRQMADSLGLTTPGRRANRWMIAAEDRPAEKPRRTSSSKAKLKVVGE